MSANNTIRKNGQIEFAAAPGVGVWWETESKKVTRVPAEATIDDWRYAAGMEWEINPYPVRFVVPGPGGMHLHEAKKYVVLARSDTDRPLGVVGSRYQITQPREVLEFFRDLIEAAGFRMCTAGTLHGGAKFWAQAKVAEDEVTRGCLNQANLLFASSADGSMGNIVKAVTTEVVCSNTLGFALAETGGAMVKVSHRSTFDADAVKRKLGITVSQYQKFLAQARELAKREVAPWEAEAFAFRLFGGKPVSHPSEVTGEALVAATKVREMRGFRKVLELFGGQGKGSDLIGRRGTAWGLVNAATEYVDHHQPARSPDNKFDAAQFGAGDNLKSKAWDQAVELLA